MIAMDLSKVLDRLLYSLLISKLRTYGLDDCTFSRLFLQDYLTGRIQRVKVGDEISCWELNQRGVPQGIVFSLQHAKRVVSNSSGLVDFTIGLVDSVFELF